MDGLVYCKERKMKKKLSALTVLACAYAAFGLEISPVLEGKMAAFSFTYDDGAYLQAYSADGGTLLSGSDVFGIQDRMPDLLWDNEPEQTFRIATDEAVVYC